MENLSGVLWRIRLFDGPVLESSLGDGAVLHQFRSAKVAALLGFLALRHGKPCSRESLMEALWPNEIDSAVLANRFRVTLASLRRQIEPPGFPFGTVLDTSIAGCIRLRDDTTWCDLSAFDFAYQANQLEEAANLLRGPLLPGIYDDWAASDQVRIEVLVEELRPVSKPESRITVKPIGNVIGHRLPLFLSRFLSRELELRQLGQLIERNRLVTITGPGGVGKTRVSVEACMRSPLQTIFIPLADCADLDSLCEAVVRNLSVVAHSGLDPMEQVMQTLARLGQIRLLLDNAEHLAEEVSRFCEEALAFASELSVVVSSRQSLQVEGEQIFRLEPLGFPSTGEVIDSASLELFPSTTLFLDRVRQSRPDFVAKESNCQTIVDICRKLEGLPLAIELAAAQITIHSIGEILENLESSLVDLRSRRRSLSSRHRSLRAAIQSSLDGLDSDTATFLGGLSVFWGGWTADAATTVTGEPNGSDQLEELVLRSLVVPSATEGPTRFSCLEVVRQLAQEKLTQGELEVLEARHQKYFYFLAEQVDEDDLDTLLPLGSERHNLQAVFTRADPHDRLFWRANRGSIMHAFIRGEHRTALRWIREFSPVVGLCTEYSDRRDWYNAALQVLSDLGLFEEASEMIAEMRRDALNHSNQIGIVASEITEGLICARLGDTIGAIRLHRQALAGARVLDDRCLLDSALSHMSGSLHEMARSVEIVEDSKAELLQESERLALELIERVGERSRRLPLAHLLAGAATYYQGRFEIAEQHLEDASNTAERLGIRTVMMYASYFEAEIASQLTDSVRAEAKLARFRDLQSQMGIFVGSSL